MVTWIAPPARTQERMVSNPWPGLYAMTPIIGPRSRTGARGDDQSRQREAYALWQRAIGRGHLQSFGCRLVPSRPLMRIARTRSRQVSISTGSNGFSWPKSFVKWKLLHKLSDACERRSEHCTTNPSCSIFFSLICNERRPVHIGLRDSYEGLGSISMKLCT